MALMTAKEYIDSLRKLNTRVYMFGEKIDNWVDHPMIRPSINCVAMTYALAQDPQYEELMTATSILTGHKINRFTHLHQSADDLVKKVKMQRLLGQKTASCFQRCVGMDAFNAVYSTTYEIDEKHGTHYHENFKKFLIYVQDNDLTVDGAMTDPKGDRSRAPHEQSDPDLYLHVVERREDGIVVMDPHRCIGCRFCMAGCPFGARSFNFRDPQPYVKDVNPEFPMRTRGVVEKCTFCTERLAQGKLPACVEASEGAMIFGDLNDPGSPVRQALSENFTIRRKPTLGTQPGVYYII